MGRGVGELRPRDLNRLPFAKAKEVGREKRQKQCGHSSTAGEVDILISVSIGTACNAKMGMGES